MYYPMRVVRDRKWKLIWNIAHPLPYPFASDLWAAPTWQAQYKQGPTTPYGVRTVYAYLHRPQFELYDMQNDPWESRNVATDPAHAQVLAAIQPLPPAPVAAKMAREIVGRLEKERELA